MDSEYPTLDRLVTAYESFQAFEERCYTLLHAIVDLPRPEYDMQRRLLHYALAKLATGHDMEQALEDIDWVNAQLDEGNMFVWHANIDAYLRFGHLYPPDLLDHVARQATSHPYEIHNGQTENHKIMIAVAGYLVAQTWPEWEEAEDTFERMDAYLNAFFNRVVRFGQGEFDSPTYSVLYLNSLATLYDFALDPQMRHKASMLLEWFLVNLAGEWLEGLFAGAHSRDYAPTAGNEDATGGRAAGWIYFGGETPDFERGEPHYAVINALSGYRAPEIVVHIAQDRAQAYVHRETHDLMAVGHPTHDSNETRRLSDAVQGFGYMSRAGVYKTTYTAPRFALSSLVDGREGDVIWAGQMRRWSLMWQSDAPGGVLFFTHPFPDGPGDKHYRRLWRGSSPYEQVLQHENVLIALCNIPPGETYKYGPRDPVPSDADPYIEGFFPQDALVEVDEIAAGDAGWIFARGETVLIAVRPLRPYQWLDEEMAPEQVAQGVVPHRRLRSDGLKNGVIVEVVDLLDYVDVDDADAAEALHRFRGDVLARTRVVIDLNADDPTVTYTSLDGNTLTLTYDGDRVVNGEVLSYDEWPLVQNPFLVSKVNSGVLTLSYGAGRRVLDFNTWTVATAVRVSGDDAGAV